MKTNSLHGSTVTTISIDWPGAKCNINLISAAGQRSTILARGLTHFNLSRLVPTLSRPVITEPWGANNTIDFAGELTSELDGKIVAASSFVAHFMSGDVIHIVAAGIDVE